MFSHMSTSRSGETCYKGLVVGDVYSKADFVTPSLKQEHLIRQAALRAADGLPK